MAISWKNLINTVVRRIKLIRFGKGSLYDRLQESQNTCSVYLSQNMILRRALEEVTTKNIAMERDLNACANIMKVVTVNYENDKYRMQSSINNYAGLIEELQIMFPSDLNVNRLLEKYDVKEKKNRCAVGIH